MGQKGKVSPYRMGYILRDVLITSNLKLSIISMEKKETVKEIFVLRDFLIIKKQKLLNITNPPA